MQMLKEAEQMTLFDLGLCCGRTSPEPLAPMEATTSEQSSKKSSASRNRQLPTFHYLAGGGRWPLADCWYGNGWSIAYRVLDAQFWGTPQRRRRIALVADFGGHAAPEILFVRKGVSGDFEQMPPERQSNPLGIGAGTCDTGSGAGRIGDTADALVYPINDKATRFQGGGATRKQDGSGNGLGIGKAGDPSPTLTAADRHIVFVKDSRPHGKDEAQRWAQKETANTLTSFDVGESRADPIVLTAFQNKASVFGVDCRNATENEELCATLQAKANGGFSYNCIHPVRIGGLVRRLTPLECERLQGFPDDWTDIGEWVDEKGKHHPESSDAARYRALGNSIAIPPWKWVIKRLCAVYERDATMASLFDGIGGFPYIWEQINGKGSCLWASEIEPFPIAVTKYHFGE